MRGKSLIIHDNLNLIKFMIFVIMIVYHSVLSKYLLFIFVFQEGVIILLTLRSK
uniref:Uncharacterized protein n=1 Tax=Octopus bimaculoides TaxID=37653 RepID=A0A0L8HPK0_OCTBM